MHLKCTAVITVCSKSQRKLVSTPAFTITRYCLALYCHIKSPSLCPLPSQESSDGKIYLFLHSSGLSSCRPFVVKHICVLLRVKGWPFLLYISFVACNRCDSYVPFEVAGTSLNSDIDLQSKQTNLSQKSVMGRARLARLQPKAPRCLV